MDLRIWRLFSSKNVVCSQYLNTVFGCFHSEIFKMIYPLSILWLHRVLIHWGRASCRLRSTAVNVIGSWWTSQLGFLCFGQTHKLSNKCFEKKLNKTSDIISNIIYVANIEIWGGGNNPYTIIHVGSVQNHYAYSLYLFSALVRLPVHSLTSRGHSQGHSHSFCSILQEGKWKKWYSILEILEFLKLSIT